MRLRDEEEDETNEKVKENFLTLSNELRIDIIQFLQSDGPATFSEIKEAVGVSDNGQLNYHLDKLLGNFVKKAEFDGEKRYPGAEFDDETVYLVKYGSEMVVKSMMATVPPEEEVPDIVEIDSPCIECGGELIGVYENELLRIECEETGKIKSMYPFPPNAFEGRTDEEALDAFNTQVRQYAEFVRRGVCPMCLGRIETEFTSDPPDHVEDSFNHLFLMVCQKCAFDMAGEADWFLLKHPEIVEVHEEHGIDINETYFWQLPINYSEHEIVSEDPLRIKTEFEIDEVTYQVFVDRDLDIVEIEKE